jgi:outer membrane lipoprotein-sorting protein
MKTLALILLLAPQENEAEQIFTRMCGKIAAARTMRVRFESTLTPGPKAFVSSGTLHVDQGNRARMEIEAKDRGDAGKTLFVSNGAKMKLRQGQSPMAGAAVPNLTHFFARLAGWGLLFGVPSIFRDEWPRDEQFEQALRAYRKETFALGPREKVGEREAQVVTFVLVITDEDDGSKIKVVIWVDRQTLLPLKKEFRSFKDESVVYTAETYHEFKLDEKFDEALFELP